MRRFLLLIHLSIFLILAIAAVFNPAVGGEGDTIMHFFWAKHVWTDADALFRSWAKPFFTLFAAPSTLFGFAGIKVFNVFCGTAASYVTSLYAYEKRWRYFYLIPLVAFIGPAYISYLNSGLTEPFSALVLISGVYLIQHDKKSSIKLVGYILISFLPFCRSEAQVLLPLFAFYAALNKDFRFIPLLASGTLIYSVLGAPFRGDLFWVFHSPYIAGASVYGQGTWTHYLERLNPMLSLPINLSFLIGILFMIWVSLKKKSFLHKNMVLVVFIPLVFITAHSTVWALGIYASAGLERVLILVFPLIWLLVIYSWEIIASRIKKQYHLVLLIALVGSSIFSTLERTKVWKQYYQKAYQIGPYQNFLKNKVQPFIQSQYPDYKTKQFVSDLPYLSLVSGHNPLDINQQVNWQRVDLGIWHQIDPDAIFIWDSHSVPFYTKIDEASLRSIEWLTPIEEWEMGGRKYILLEAKENMP